MNRYAVASIDQIQRYQKSEICHALCGEKPFGSRHWEYPWAIEKSGIMEEKNLRILDVAPDFTFPYTAFLKKDHQVTFIDLEARKWSDSLVWGAKTAELAKRSDYRIMDVRNMDFADSSFDRIFCISVLEHIVCPTQNPDHPNLAQLFSPTEARPALKEMRRCLKKGGRLLLTIDIYGGDKWRDLFEKWDIFADLDRAGFRIDNFPDFNRKKAFTDTRTFISQFHGPYITLGFCLVK